MRLISIKSRAENMTIKDLINTDIIIGIIQKLGNQGRKFKSEAQFQFELAWALKKYLQEQDCENKPEVILEHYSMFRKTEDKIKKFFTDIMILDGAGNYIPIELKYKTVSVKAADPFDDYGSHGATDLGRFDYLWDVKRIQLLKYKNEPSFEFDKKLVNFCGGFAVLLTNDNHYWKVTSESFPDRSNKPLYYNFCIGAGDVISAEKKLRWKNDGTGTWVENTWRNDHDYVVPLCFDREYVCEWRDYQGDKWFKYIIMEV